MRRPLKILGLAFLGIFLAIQLVPVQRTNPPFDSATSLGRSMPLPAPVKAILDRSCRDCHTNETRWPGYAYVAPASWLLVGDVNEARENLNFKRWILFKQGEELIGISGLLLQRMSVNLADVYRFDLRLAYLWPPAAILALCWGWLAKKI